MQPRTFFKVAAAVAVIVTGACSTQTGSLAPPVTLQVPHTAEKAAQPCTPTLWATSTFPSAVYGYRAANSAPCVTLVGPYGGLSLNAPISLAIGKNPDRLYVADLGNARIAVFNYRGTFVKTWSTLLGGQSYQPYGVCVGPNGWVGVGNRQYNYTGAAGNAEFFRTQTVNNGRPTGYATGILSSDQFCAFDRVGNFFVDGPSSSGQKIAYLARGHVGKVKQALVDSQLGTASYWVGMYSRVNSPADDTLTVGTAALAPTQNVANWKVAGPKSGPLTFAALPTYALSSYPEGADPIYQLAPAPGGSTGSIFAADYGSSVVLKAPANGGSVSVYNSVSWTTGVATRPAGQY